MSGACARLNSRFEGRSLTRVLARRQSPFGDGPAPAACATDVGPSTLEAGQCDARESSRTPSPASRFPSGSSPVASR
jgi:hypothetical protein